MTSNSFPEKLWHRGRASASPRTLEQVLDDDPAASGISERVNAYTGMAVASLHSPERRSGEGERRRGSERRQYAEKWHSLRMLLAIPTEKRSGVERRRAANRRQPLRPPTPQMGRWSGPSVEPDTSDSATGA
jgi:hypothetical protein